VKLHRLLLLPAAVVALAGSATLATPGTVSADELIHANRVSCFNGTCRQIETSDPNSESFTQFSNAIRNNLPTRNSSVKSEPSKGDKGKGDKKWGNDHNKGGKKTWGKGHNKGGISWGKDQGKGGSKNSQPYGDGLNIKVGNQFNHIAVKLNQWAEEDAQANIFIVTQNATAISLGGNATASNDVTAPHLENRQ
jgi:hypothetical protein